MVAQFEARDAAFRRLVPEEAVIQRVAGGGWVIAPTGAVLGRILMPAVTANPAWGGAGNRALFLTASTSVYRLARAIAGQPLSAA